MTTTPQSSSRCGMGQFALALIAIVTNSAYTSLPPILPLEIDHHNLNEKCTSVVFLAFTLGSLVAPPLVSRHFEKYGTIQVIAYSLVGMALGFWCLGHVFAILDGDDGPSLGGEEVDMMDDASDSITIDDGGATSASQDTMDITADEMLHIPNSNDLEPEDDPTKFGLLPPIIPPNPHQTIIVISLTIIQLFLGAFYATITTGYYSLVTLIFAGSAESAMSSVEAAVGIGYVVGPIFGSMLYEKMGYRYCYGTISMCMLFMAGITLKILAPYLQGGSESTAGYSRAAQQSEDEGGGGDLELSEMDNSSNEVDDDHHGHDNRETTVDTNLSQQPISALSLLKFPKLLIGALTLTWIDVTWSFLEPLLSKHLDHTFDVSMSEIGVIFSITSIVYVPAVYLVQFLPSSGQGRHRTISAAVMLSPIGVLCVGSNSLTILILGVVLLGIFPTPVFVMLLPWMQEKALDLYPDPNVSRLVNDLTATIYNTALTMGQITGYILGPLLASRGFSQTTKLVALLTFCQGVMFFVGAGGGSEAAGEREQVPRYSMTVEDDDQNKTTEMTIERTPNRRRRSDDGENTNPNAKVSSTPPKEK
jgi:MFS family permease